FLAFENELVKSARVVGRLERAENGDTRVVKVADRDERVRRHHLSCLPGNRSPAELRQAPVPACASGSRKRRWSPSLRRRRRPGSHSRQRARSRCCSCPLAPPEFLSECYREN